MSHSFFRLTVFTLIITTLLIGAIKWSGQTVTGDAFLYLTQLNDDERNAAIYAFDTQTGVTQSILKEPDILDFTVSPDGQFLLYQKRENRETSFYHYHILSGISEFLLSGDIATPRWSPDGQWIAYRNTQRREQGLYIISVNDGEIRQITDDAYGVYSWSSDSQHLIYVTDYESDYGIFSASIMDNKTELLTTFEGYMTGIEGRGFPVLAVVDSIPQHYDFISGEYEILSERMIFSGHPTWSANKEQWAFISVNPEREDWGLTIYNVEGDLLEQYQPEGLTLSSSLVWWLSG